MKLLSEQSTSLDILDDDCLTLIMHHLTVSDVIRASQLCHRVRSIALATPGLWREVKLSTTDVKLDSVAETILERSRPNVLLDLTIELVHELHDEIYRRNIALYGRFRSLASRIQHLRICSRAHTEGLPLELGGTSTLSPFLQFLQNVPLTVPNLATLDLNFNAPMFAPIVRPFRPGSLANIRTLRVAHINLAAHMFLSAAPWPNVRDLELASRIGESDLQAIARIFPNAERLIIHEVSSNDDAGQGWAAVPTGYRTPEEAGSKIVDVEVKYHGPRPVDIGGLRYLAGFKRFGVTLGKGMQASTCFVLLKLAVFSARTTPNKRVHMAISGSARDTEHKLCPPWLLHRPSRPYPMVIEFIVAGDDSHSGFIKSDHFSAAADVAVHAFVIQPVLRRISLTLDGPDAIDLLLAIGRDDVEPLSQVDEFVILLARSEELDFLVEATRKLPLMPQLRKIRLRAADGHVQVRRSQLADLLQALRSVQTSFDVKLELGYGVLAQQ